MGATKKNVSAPSKAREKLNNATLFRPEQYLKFLAEVPKGRVITPAAVSDKFKINASLARKALKDMCRQRLIKRVIQHTGLYLYTRTDEQVKAAEEKAAQLAAQEVAQAAKKQAALDKKNKDAAKKGGDAAAAKE